MISQRRSGWPFFKICMKRTLSGELRGCFQMRFCQGGLYPQLRD
ncbi:hypothetical protein Gotur_028940 [Gossypium turneri]